MRLHIMGAPGSGKTSLAKVIGERYGVTVWDLDWVVYDGETRRERSLPDFERELALVLQHTDRITEGAYHQGAWLRHLLAAADLIIWLDVPWRVCAARMTKRHFSLTLTGDNPHPGTMRFLRFLNYTRHAKPRIDQSTSSCLDPFPDKALRCRTSADLADAWDRINELNAR